MLHSHWTHRYSLLKVRVVPGDHVTVLVADAEVDSAAVVVPVAREEPSSTAPVPAGLLDFHMRVLTAPVCDEAAAEARTRNASDQLVLANVPL
jgi:hypothetical protein